jgi:hypothetical protein
MILLVIMDVVQKNKEKLSKVLSTKLSIDDYNAFQILTRLEYQGGLIKKKVHQNY